MISAIITGYKEPRTIGRAVSCIAKQLGKNDEVLVVAPDDETLREAKKLAGKYKNLRTIKDGGKGKPAALNLAVSKARGNILILSDGDVYVGEDSIKNLLVPFENEKIGAVSGRPVSLNKKDGKLGFWAFVLSEVANERRIVAARNRRRFFCSGYLFAIRKSLFDKIPEELLSEDGYVSHRVYERGYGIAYSPEAKVYVKYPDNFEDWIKQKRRSAGGYNQIKKMTGAEMRSFKLESKGALNLLKFVSNTEQFFWLIELFFARVYLWYKIYLDINVKKKSQKEIWQRVESTK